MSRISLVLALVSISILVGSAVGENVDLSTLKLVQVIFRHGERVPEKPYPTDPYNSNSFWKEGWGQLTDVGKAQAYSLGQYLRSRYKDFIAPEYVPDQIYAQSSDLDRTIITAQICLAGMFPAENGTAWNPDLNWQPVPLRTIATEHDNRIRFKKVCPKYDTDYNDYINNSEEMKGLNEKNKELFEYLANNSGVPVKNIDEIDDFYATLMVEEMLGLQIPEWAKSVVHTENFQYLYNLSFASATNTPELKRLRTGPLVQYLVNNMQTRALNSSMTTKMFTISGHDTTLVAILNTLGVLDLHRPYYTSAFMVELHQDKQSQEFFVHLVYRNDTSRDPYELHVPGCEFHCPLSKFVDYTLPIIPVNWDEECGLSMNSNESHSYLYYVAAIGTGIIILAFFVYLTTLMYRGCKTRRERAAEYQRF